MDNEFMLSVCTAIYWTASPVKFYGVSGLYREIPIKCHLIFHAVQYYQNMGAFKRINLFN
jgi:hypothetical protein